jgi:hypothetical protein
MYSNTCTPTNVAPITTVATSHSRRAFWMPSCAAANAFTMVTLLQMSRNVFTAVIGIASGVSLGWAPHAAGCATRRMMYEPMRAVKNMTSEARNTHMPSFSL